MEALLLPILLIAVFYFLLIRPQQRQRRQMVEMQQTLAVGSKVMTGGGLLATVVAIDEDEVELEVAPGVTNRYVRRAIVNVLSSPETEESVFDSMPADDELGDTTTGGATDRADQHKSENPANDGETR